MVTTTPFSSILHQLLSTAKPANTKGKGKVRSRPTDFLTSSTVITNDNNLNDTVSTFVNFVKEYEKQAKKTEGNCYFINFELNLTRIRIAQCQLWKRY